MLNTLLATTVESLSYGDRLFWGIFVFLLGMIVIFVGICVIILFVMLIGTILNKTQNSKKVKKQNDDSVDTTNEVSVVDDGEIPEQIKVAIIAAVSAYYSSQNSNCEFKVKKIKRI